MLSAFIMVLLYSAHCSFSRSGLYLVQTLRMALAMQRGVGGGGGGGGGAIRAIAQPPPPPTPSLKIILRMHETSLVCSSKRMMKRQSTSSCSARSAPKRQCQGVEVSSFEPEEVFHGRQVRVQA